MPVVPPDPLLVGRWSRSLLVRPDGTEDRSTSVTWLQAGSRYVDLRLPAGLPVRGPVAELHPEELARLAEVEGFAGRLRADGEWTCWDRSVDLQPAQPAPDEGRLDADGADLVETGRHAAYREHWVRRPGDDGPVCAADLEDLDTGAPALLVRVGSDVGWARGRAEALPPGGTLADVVGSASPAAVPVALDAEVALASLAPGELVVRTASSVPGLLGAELCLEVGGGVVHALDVAPDGRAVRRRWRIRAVEGDPGALPFRRSGPPLSAPISPPHRKAPPA